MEATLKVMSFNLKRDSRFSRKNRWSCRKEHASRFIMESGADIIGVQELLPSMRSDIMELLCNYNIFGFGRTRRLTNEQSAIILPAQDTDVRYNKTFWLSKKPEKQGSRAYFSVFPRICTVCEVYVKHLDCMVRVFNTHFDHICSPARLLSVRIILEYMHRLNQRCQMPTILMGDMNAKPDSKRIQVLSHNLHGYPDIHLTNIYDRIAPEKVQNTYHGFKGKQKQKPIDYIFVSDDFEITDCLIDKTEQDGRYPSDHFPLIATLQLKSSKQQASK